MAATVCPKCHQTSGDSWSQCRGICPMAGSPHEHNCEIPALEEGGLWTCPICKARWRGEQSYVVRLHGSAPR